MNTVYTETQVWVIFHVSRGHPVLSLRVFLAPLCFCGYPFDILLPSRGVHPMGNEAKIFILAIFGGFPF